jgi:hypothetical protein
LAVELLVAGRRRGLDGVALNHQRVQIYHFDVAMQGLENCFPWNAIRYRWEGEWASTRSSLGANRPVTVVKTVLFDMLKWKEGSKSARKPDVERWENGLLVGSVRDWGPRSCQGWWEKDQVIIRKSRAILGRGMLRWTWPATPDAACLA